MRNGTLLLADPSEWNISSGSNKSKEAASGRFATFQVTRKRSVGEEDQLALVGAVSDNAGLHPMFGVVHVADEEMSSCFIKVLVLCMLVFLSST